MTTSHCPLCAIEDRYQGWTRVPRRLKKAHQAEIRSFINAEPDAKDSQPKRIAESEGFVSALVAFRDARESGGQTGVDQLLRTRSHSSAAASLAPVVTREESP